MTCHDIPFSQNGASIIRASRQRTSPLGGTHFSSFHPSLSMDLGLDLCLNIHHCLSLFASLSSYLIRPTFVLFNTALPSSNCPSSDTCQSTAIPSVPHWLQAYYDFAPATYQANDDLTWPDQFFIHLHLRELNLLLQLCSVLLAFFRSFCLLLELSSCYCVMTHVRLYRAFLMYSANCPSADADDSTGNFLGTFEYFLRILCNVGLA